MPTDRSTNTVNFPDTWKAEYVNFPDTKGVNQFAATRTPHLSNEKWGVVTASRARYHLGNGLRVK